jgi:hypothetical protein
MHAAVLDLLERHEATWAARPPVAAAVASLRAAVVEADALDLERDSLATTGLTAEKAEARDAMEAAAVRLVRVLRPYARATGDRALLADVDLTPSDFDNASDAAALSAAERVHAAATAHLAALAPYGVVAADATTLREAIEAFRPLGAARDATGGQREARTEALPAAFARARATLALLDDLIPGVVGDPILTAEYARTRRTDDR